MMGALLPSLLWFVVVAVVWWCCLILLRLAFVLKSVKVVAVMSTLQFPAETGVCALPPQPHGAPWRRRISPNVPCPVRAPSAAHPESYPDRSPATSSFHPSLSSRLLSHQLLPGTWLPPCHSETNLSDSLATQE